MYGMSIILTINVLYSKVNVLNCVTKANVELPLPDEQNYLAYIVF